ncbi:hypothetical protein BLGI_717 [Brevibacillus laterosporus GI-9]|nr:hypothetical protein BLGI_717 [Brevibacillus laterosporus GI-9]
MITKLSEIAREEPVFFNFMLIQQQKNKLLHFLKNKYIA